MSAAPGAARLEELEALLASGEGLLFLFFGAPWCPTCRIMQVVLSEFSERYPQGVKVLFFHVADRDVLAVREKVLWPRGLSFSASAIPVTFVFWQGRSVEKYIGAITNSRLTADLAAELIALGYPIEQEEGFTAREEAAIAQEAEINRRIAACLGSKGVL